MAILGRDLTTIRVGGVIDSFEQPDSVESLITLLKSTVGLCKAIGGGSNLLFADGGFRGTVIRPSFHTIMECEQSRYSSQIEVWQNTESQLGRYYGSELYDQSLKQTYEQVLLSVGASVPWAKLVSYCLNNRLTGLEKYARIPCRVGGAIRNNIHAGSELLGGHVAAVQTVDRQGVLHTYNQLELGFEYDRSRFIDEPEIITEVLFYLSRVSEQQSQLDSRTYHSILQKKAEAQPSGANCGSVFQNVAANGKLPTSAGWYIEQSGCKGLRQGGMEVSPLHANFIVNFSNGSQLDFIKLAQSVVQRVNEEFKIQLTPEVEVIDEMGGTVWG